MMKSAIKYIFVLGALLVMTSSCADFLDKAPNSEMPAEEVFRDPTKFRHFQEDIYSYLNSFCFGPNRETKMHASYAYGGLGRIRAGSFEAITDLAKATEPGTTTSVWAKGDWSDGLLGIHQELILPYTEGYKAIRKCNQVLKYYPDVENMEEAEMSRYIGETLFLRAFFYFEMIKRFGGVPYIDWVVDLEEDMDIPRDSYDYCAGKILEDLQRIIDENLLPVKQDGPNLGRPTLGAAMAYKARVLLYYASPLNNDHWNSDPSRWKAAAEAAYDLIQLNVYSLNTWNEWDNQFYTTDNKERIFQRLEDPHGFEEGIRYGWAPQSMTHGAPGLGTNEMSGTYPTQNFVDMFEMADGSIPIKLGAEYDGLHPVIHSETGYSDAAMYENRDPRFYKIVAHDGMTQWFNISLNPRPTIDLAEVDYSKPGNPAGRNTTTTRYNVGYLSKKMWPAQYYGGSSERLYTPWTFIRYSELYMIYAEAMNEAFGPDIDGLGKGMTARDALNTIRNRDLTGPNRRDVKVAAGDKEAFRERIINDNAIEFFLEEHRWWDICRWKKGVETFDRPIYRIRIIREADGTSTLIRDEIEKHVFKEYMHRYPLPKSEVEKSKALEQNPGWEVTE
ncbi:MAG: RagB/SusD family nutrient uptake outer membrane protein [Candidatus Symbiothrix sp.]|jgi:hypothetical protein|nr:RagB/SusD family nutrient uptake outer membrane protein [Candidatus Symbiothrix sp.]